MNPLLLNPDFPITALVYNDSAAADRALRNIAVALMEAGCRLAGLVQINTPRPGRSRCDMLLEELASGEHVGISRDHGPEARGCALDVGQLLTAMEKVRAALSTKPDLVILNKFGKTEAEGGGFRPLIADAIESGLPLLIGVPWRNIESWRLFAGPLSHEIHVPEINLPVILSTSLTGRDVATSLALEWLQCRIILRSRPGRPKSRSERRPPAVRGHQRPGDVARVF